MSSSTLKLIAIGAMVIDHIGFIFFPDLLVLRAIGRIAFPIFAFLIAIGFTKTSNVRAYIFRLALFAVISQIPYMVAHISAESSPIRLNIFFTLAAGLTALVCIRSLGTLAGGAITIGLALFSELLIFEYGAYGVLLVVASCLFLKGRAAGAVSFITLLSLYSALMYVRESFGVQIFGLISLPFILSYNGMRGAALPRDLFYWFYPAHLAALGAIKVFLLVKNISN